MNNIIHLPKDTAATMTTYKELLKMYDKRDPKKYAAAIKKNEDRYEKLMDEVLGRH